MPRKKISLTVIGIVLCCALVLIPMLSSILYFSTSIAHQLEENTHQTASFYINQLTEQASDVLRTLHGCIYYLMSDRNAQAIMSNPHEATPAERLVVEEGLNRAFFVGDRLEQNTVTGIYLVKNSEQYLSVLRSGIYLGTSMRINQVYHTFQNKNSARDLYVHPDYPDYCYLIVDYFELDRMSPLGKIIIELNLSGLLDTNYLTSIYPQASVMLRTTDGRILSTPSETFADVLQNNTSNFVDSNGKAYYHDCRKISPSHVLIDVFIPHSEIFKASNNAIKVYIFFAFVVLLITLAIGLLTIYFLSKPLRQMLSKIDRLSTGDLSVRMDPTPYQETERMSTTFNNMADRLELLFDEVYEQGILLRDAEFKLLESQIRPHFIFNVLEQINMRCMEAGQNHICHMVSNLAQLLRANITYRHAQTIPFREELRYVRYYLELQKERFGDSLSYSIDLEDPSILDYLLPKLTIQPLVENSIVHGLEPKRGGGTVQIGIWEDEDAVYIRVSDDGVGFDPALADLEPAKDDSSSQHNHIALTNISRRIQLLYGSPYGLHIVSAPMQGTEITVTLPASPTTPKKG